VAAGNGTKGRILALDYGSRRIGMAVSDPLGFTAQPLPPLRREGDRRDVEAIARAAEAVGAVEVVVGLPLLPDGGEGTEAGRVRRFVEKLREHLGIPVGLWDERMTTVQAEKHLVASGVRREARREVRDSVAACLILQTVLDFRSRQ